MGKLVPWGCITNEIPIDDSLGTPWSPDIQCMWDALQGWLAEQAEEGGVAAAEPLMEEDNKEEDRRRGSSVAGMVLPLQAPELVEDGPMWPRLWFLGQSAQEVGRGLPASEKALGEGAHCRAPTPGSR